MKNHSLLDPCQAEYQRLVYTLFQMLLGKMQVVDTQAKTHIWAMMKRKNKIIHPLRRIRRIQSLLLMLPFPKARGRRYEALRTVRREMLDCSKVNIIMLIAANRAETMPSLLLFMLSSENLP